MNHTTQTNAPVRRFFASILKTMGFASILSVLMICAGKAQPAHAFYLKPLKINYETTYHQNNYFYVDVELEEYPEGVITIALPNGKDKTWVELNPEYFGDILYLSHENGGDLQKYPNDVENLLGFNLKIVKDSQIGYAMAGTPTDEFLKDPIFGYNMILYRLPKPEDEGGFSKYYNPIATYFLIGNASMFLCEDGDPNSCKEIVFKESNFSVDEQAYVRFYFGHHPGGPDQN